jgi:DNA-binding beta-propeller fold protein YncE
LRRTVTAGSLAPALATGVVALAVGLAGCGGSTGKPHARNGHRVGIVGPPGRRRLGTGVGQPTAPRVRAGSAVISPHSSGACSSEVSQRRPLTGVADRFGSIPGDPFGVVATPTGRLAFVSSPTESAIDVVSLSEATPRVLRHIRLGGAVAPVGLTLTADGRYLLAATHTGATVLSVARAERGAGDAELGSLRVRQGGGGIEVAVTPDGDYAFVSLENSGDIAVFNLRRAETDDFQGSYLIGTIGVGEAPVGLAVSPDGRWLYATSQVGGPGVRPAGSTGTGSTGTVTTISVGRAIQDPARSVVSSMSAGCSPVRVAISKDGRVVWVTARGSDELLALSASGLQHGSHHALLAAVRVGEAPVGLELVNGGRQMVVADSNRFGARGAGSDLTVISTAPMLAGRASILGKLRAGGFPREMSLTPDGRTLLVTDFSSGQLQAIRVSSLR